jgi:hypothetical protein
MPAHRARMMPLDTSERVQRECGLLKSGAKLMRLARWPQLQSLYNISTLGVTRQWHFWMQNIDIVEPLSIAAYIAAIHASQQRAPTGWIM